LDSAGRVHFHAVAAITFNLRKAILPDARAAGIDCNVSACGTGVAEWELF
jgi:hypothetical protein